LLLYSPAQDEGHIKWPSLRAELATNLMPGPPGPRAILQMAARFSELG
jgi:hypothetical protein